jgi:hypothetical protein
VERVADVADWRAGELVRPSPSSRSSTVVAAAGPTVGTSSRLLHDVVGAVYDRLGFDAVADAVFRDLVIARIVEPYQQGRLHVCTD